MWLLAIDPGPIESAWVVWDGNRLHGFGKATNEEVLHAVMVLSKSEFCQRMALEQVKSYGMPVGDSTFETVYWSGRFAEAFGASCVDRIPRKTICADLCGSARAKDANIRQALIDRYGPPGTKKSPGVLYGVSKDVWSALALAVVWFDRRGVTR